VAKAIGRPYGESSGYCEIEPCDLPTFLMMLPRHYASSLRIFADQSRRLAQPHFAQTILPRFRGAMRVCPQWGDDLHSKLDAFHLRTAGGTPGFWWIE
jgi:hypothetical protein